MAFETDGTWVDAEFVEEEETKRSGVAFETDGTWVDAEFVEEEETKRSGAAFETDGTPLRFVPYYEHV